MKFPEDPTAMATAYLAGLGDPAARFASFDHCYKFFQTARGAGDANRLAEPEYLQTACLHLGFYLASWGMYRGSAQLHRYNSAALVEAINLVAHAPEDLWEIDVARYDSATIDVVLNFKNALANCVPGGHSDTLTSKIMLGVFGCVPAFDRYFALGFGVRKFDARSLSHIRSYFDRHRDTIESLRQPAMDFGGSPTNVKYSQAKVVDMIGYVAGGGPH